jgi:hypothetical protein
MLRKAGMRVPLAMLLAHNRRQQVSAAPSGYVANGLRHLAQWVQLLARVEKVPMAGEVSCLPAKSIS